MVPRKDSKSTSPLFLRLFSIIAGLTAFAAVTVTIDDIGVTADEPHYYKSCLQEIAWFRQSISDFKKGDWAAPFHPEVLDRYWNFELVFNVHPSFYKLGSSLTLVLFERWLGTIGAYRLSPAIMFSILVGLLFFTVGRRYGLWSGFWAAAGFALMPRIFGHAHFGATDTPITFLWFASAVSFHRALESKRWALVFAIVYGLALSTKFTAFVIPVPLMAYVILSRRFKDSLWPIGIALVLSPLIMIGLNPQWWHSTFERLYIYVTNSATRSQYFLIPIYYLGKQYDFYLPWHHPLIYTLFTVPPIVLSFFLYGFWCTVRRPFSDQWALHMLLHWLVIIGVMILPSSPGHDGERLFLPSFPFLAAISARGFHDFVSKVMPQLRSRFNCLRLKLKHALASVFLGFMIIPAAWALAHIHPYELSYYNCLAGGISGANKLGMETTYWWDPFNEKACRMINSLPDSSVIFTRNNDHFLFLQRLDLIKPSLKIRSENVEYVLQYCRQGIFDDHDWLLYRRGVPEMEISLDGIRLWAIFKGFDVSRKILAIIQNSNNVESLYEGALLYLHLGRPDSVLLALNKYLKYRPGEYRANMRAAILLNEINLPKEALKYLKRLADSTGHSEEWNFNMGRTHYQMGEYEQAIPFLKECLKYRSLNPKTRLVLADIYYIMGRFEESAEQYKLVLRIKPEDPIPLYSLGMIYQALKDNEKAKSYYSQLLNNDPKHLATLISMGILLRNEGKLAEAEDYFLRALDVDSTNIESNYILANLHIEKGELAQAEKRYLKILEINPNDSQTHLALAILYLKDSARHAEALEHFRRLARLVPSKAEVIQKKYILPLEMERSGRAVIKLVP